MADFGARIAELEGRGAAIGGQAALGAIGQVQESFTQFQQAQMREEWNKQLAKQVKGIDEIGQQLGLNPGETEVYKRISMSGSQDGVTPTKEGLNMAYKSMLDIYNARMKKQATGHAVDQNLMAELNIAQQEASKITDPSEKRDFLNQKRAQLASAYPGQKNIAQIKAVTDTKDITTGIGEGMRAGELEESKRKTDFAIKKDKRARKGKFKVDYVDEYAGPVAASNQMVQTLKKNADFSPEGYITDIKGMGILDNFGIQKAKQFIGLITGNKDYVIDTSKAIANQNAVSQWVQAYLKSISGVAVADSEFKRVVKSLGNTTFSSWDEFANAMNNKISELRQRIKLDEEFYNDNETFMSKYSNDPLSGRLEYLPMASDFVHVAGKTEPTPTNQSSSDTGAVATPSGSLMDAIEAEKKRRAGGK